MKVSDHEEPRKRAGRADSNFGQTHKIRPFSKHIGISRVTELLDPVTDVRDVFLEIYSFIYLEPQV